MSRGEPCFAIIERTDQGPDRESIHRFQYVMVVRNDKPAVYCEDLGLASLYKAPPIYIPGGAQDDAGKFWFEHNVGELRDLAEAAREDYRAFLARMQEVAETSTLIHDAIEQYNERHEIIHNRTLFGPAGRGTQRIGYPRRQALESERERRRRVRAS